MKKRTALIILFCMTILLSACSEKELDTAESLLNTAPATAVLSETEVSVSETQGTSKKQKETFPQIKETVPELSLYDEIYAELSQFHNVIKFDKKIDTEEVSDAVNKIERVHPEIFWINGYSLQYNDVSAQITFKVINEYNADTLRQMSDAMFAKVEEICRTINQNSSDYEKALLVHDYLVANTEYDQSAVNTGKGIWSTAYGCLMNGLAVCQGYSQAYQILMNRLGIECGLCSGDAKGEAHAWNYILLNGEYYWLDVTWDDPVSENNNDWIHHDYFLIDDATLSRSRTFDENNDFIPVCDSMEQNYFIQNQNYLTQYYFSEIDSRLSAHAEEGRIEVMFSTPEAYEMAINDLFTSETVWTAQIFQETGGTINYQTDDEMCVLRLYFNVNA